MAQDAIRAPAAPATQTAAQPKTAPPAADAPRRRRGSRRDSILSSPIFETLQISDFRWIWVGSFISFMAMNMQMITRGWLVLRLENDSPLALVLVMVSFAAPMTIVSLVGGALADRFPKKNLVIISQTVNAVLTFILAMLDASGTIWFGAVLIIGVLNGSMMAINMPSRQALISDIVPETKLMNAVALNNSAMNLTRIVGPAVAGFLIIFIDTSGVFYLISFIYVFAVLSLFMVKTNTVQARKDAKKSVGKDIFEGLRYVWADMQLRGLIMMAFLPSLFGFTLFALLPVWAREALNVNSSDLGILMTMMGVGALIGTLGLAGVRGFNRRGMLLLGCGVTWGIALIALANSMIFPVAMPFLLIIGLISSVHMSLNMTLTQLIAAPEMRGRVMSIMMMTFGLMPIGALPFGTIAEYIGTANALTISGAMLSLLILAFAFAYPAFRRIE
ncbi:MAG: MFS transporter [Chloroflexi bacterium]|nr:MFS transporter [Chloroflexota bacterium]